MKVLFIGGTGVISSACSREAVERGIDLYLLNRGESTRPVPDEVRIINADIRNKESVHAALGAHDFDVVVNWIGFVPEHIETDLELFRGRTGQYVYISSASVYETPPSKLPITENTPLSNPFWQYSRDKIACEDRLMRAFHEERFPVTIVRPSHTYDRSNFPLKGRYTPIDRMRKGKKIIVHGDGTSLWVLTHNSDFARGFVPLLGDKRAIGEAFHITTDALLSWNQIYELTAKAAGATADIVHIPSETIAKYDPEWGCDLLGDKMHSMIFDNSKIRQFVPSFSAPIPFSQGIEEIIAWHDADPARQIVDEPLDILMDKVIADWEAAF
jgi:nucleoside-diphosphate-sugar epimerase